MLLTEYAQNLPPHLIGQGIEMRLPAKVAQIVRSDARIEGVEEVALAVSSL